MPPPDRAAFVQRLYPIAKRYEQQTRIPAAVLLGIAAHESNFGNAGGNMLFGIKGPGMTAATWESVGGKRVDMNDSFRTYATPDAAFKDFVGLVSSGRYAPAWQRLQQTGDWQGFLHGINQAGYATDPQWAGKIANFTTNTIHPLVPQNEQGGPAMPPRTTTGTPTQAPTPKPTDAHAALLTQRQQDLATAQQKATQAQAVVQQLSTPGKDEDAYTPEGKAARRQREQALRQAQTAANQANTDARRVAADVQRIQGQMAQSQDASAVQRDPTGLGAVYNRPSTITPNRNERQVGVFDPKTGQISYSDNPNYVDPGDEPITPYQGQSLAVSQMNAAASLMHAQVAAGTLDFNTAKDFLDRIDKLAPVTVVDGKRYLTGMEPGGFYQQLGKKYGYTASVVEAPDVDYGGALGRPDLNQYVHDNRYASGMPPRGQAEVEQAQQALKANPPAKPQGFSPLSPESSAAMSEVTGGGDVGPTFGAQAGEPGGPTQADVQANEQPPNLPPQPAGLPGGPTQPQVQANEQPPQFGAPPVGRPGGPSLPAVQANERPPAGAARLDPNQRLLAGRDGGFAVETTQPNLITGTSYAGAFPDAAPTPAQRTAIGAAAPLPPQMGSAFRDRMVQHLVTEQGKSQQDAERIADAYLAQNGGQ